MYSEAKYRTLADPQNELGMIPINLNLNLDESRRVWLKPAALLWALLYAHLKHICIVSRVLFNVY